MPNISLQTSNAHQRAIDTHHNAQPFLSEKQNQHILNQLSASPSSPEKHAVAQGMLHCVALLSLVSHSLYDCEVSQHNGITSSDITPLQRSSPSPVEPPSSNVLNNLSSVSTDITLRMHDGFTHLAKNTVRLADNVLAAISKTIEKYDFIPLLPGASAHVAPRPKKSTAAPWVEQDDVKIQKLDFSCAENRKTLFFANVLRQMGKTLKNPITELVNESQTIHYFSTLRTGCPSAEDTKKLTAITLRVDNILSTVTSFLPYLNRVALVQSIGGSLLQLIADDIEGRSIEHDEIEDIIEQINFLAKSTVDISPVETNGSGRIHHLEFPENIYAKNNKIFTTIGTKNWQLIFKENRYLALHNSELREVIYSRNERRWVFLDDSKHNPVTGTLLQRLHQLGPDGIAQRGGLNRIARDYFVEPEALETYIKGDSRLSSDGLKLISDAEIDQPKRAQGTLDKFYDRLAQAADKIPAPVNPSFHEQAHEPSSSPIKSVIITPKDVARIEERRLKSDDTQPHTSQQGTAETNETPAKHSIRHARRHKLKKLVRRLEQMGKNGIRDEGGLASIAIKNDVPLKSLKRYIHADGSLTETGKHFLTPKAKKAASQSRQPLVPKKTDDHALTEHQSDMIEPHKGIAKLITKRVSGFSKISLEGNIDGTRQPLVYNLEKDVFYPAIREGYSAWKKGSDIPYIAIESSDELSILPESQRDRVVTHQQRTASLKAMGSELDLVNLEKQLAENPPRYEIPHKICSIWVGSNKIPDHLVNNVAHNAQVAKSGRNPFEFSLYLSRQNREAYIHNMSVLKKNAPHVSVVTLEDTAFYQEFKQSKYYEQFYAATRGKDNGATNYAAGSDGMRFPAVHHDGGFYIDMDDRLISHPITISLKIKHNGLLLHPLMNNEKLGMSYQYPTSLFGSHKGNPILKEASEEIYQRFQENKDIYSSRPPYGDTEEFDTYAKSISYVSGPAMFDSVIARACPEEKQILEAQKLMYFPLDKIHHGQLHQMMGKLYQNDIVQLDKIAQVGSENSWVHSRR